MNLLDSLLLWLLAKRRSNRKSEELKHMKCPVCGSTEHDSWRTGGCAVFIGRGFIGSKDNFAPVKDTVDKDVSI